MDEQDTLRAIVKVSRGRLGGSTYLTALAERAILGGRPTLLADGDRHNKGISQSPLYAEHGLPLPAASDRVTMQRWLTDAFGAAVERRKNLVLDIGGGDELVQEYAATSGLIEAGEALGITVIGLFMYGTEPGDLDFIGQLQASGKFNPTRSLIVQNEWAAPEGMPPQRAFDEAGTAERIALLKVRALKQVRMPRLLCMGQVMESGLSFHEAAEGKRGRSGTPLGPMERFWVKKWLGDIDTDVMENGAEAWVP